MYTRKKFIETAALTIGGMAVLPTSSTQAVPRGRIKAIAFDGFAIFNPQLIFKHAKELLPGEGSAWVDVWVAKQFSYQWLRTLGGKYKSFLDISRDALIDTTKQYRLSLSREQLDDIMDQYRQINIWDDVKVALQQLSDMDLKISMLSNMTEEMIRQGLNNGNIGRYFTTILSADKVKMYKPSSAAYQMGVDYHGVKREEILFVAFADWDMAGAKWFGYPTYWVNRLNMPLNNLDAIADGTGNALYGIADFIREYNR